MRLIYVLGAVVMGLVLVVGGASLATKPWMRLVVDG